MLVTAPNIDFSLSTRIITLQPDRPGSRVHIPFRCRNLWNHLALLTSLFYESSGSGNASVGVLFLGLACNNCAVLHGGQELFPFPVRLALLDKRRHALFLILRGKQIVKRPPLICQPIGQEGLESMVDCFFAELDG